MVEIAQVDIPEAGQGLDPTVQYWLAVVLLVWLVWYIWIWVAPTLLRRFRQKRKAEGTEKDKQQPTINI